jgi:hypothetical protein
MTNLDKEFLSKLKVLLEEYDASIDWSCDPCSDMHGVYDDHLEITIKDQIVFKADNPYITSRDL